MRLLTVIPQMGTGGAEVVAATLARAAARDGHDSLLASAPGFRLAALDDVRHLPVPLDGRRAGDLARSVRILRRSVRRDRPDVVHAHNPKAAVVARLAVGSGVPVVTTVHGVPARSLGRATALLRGSTDRVIAVSPYVAAQLAVHGFPAGRIDVVENAVEPPVRLDRVAARAELGLAPDAFVALCLARLVDQKRHDLLLEAWPAVVRAEKAAGAVLLVAGDGPNRGAIERAVERGRMAGSVRVLGERPDAARLLAASDVLVLPTDWEGLPISLLEAMAVGLPVVVSRVGGVVETLGSAVRLVEPGSASALAEALGELASDPERRRSLGRRGQELVERRYGTARMLHQHADVYAQLLVEHRAARHGKDTP